MVREVELSRLQLGAWLDAQRGEIDTRSSVALFRVLGSFDASRFIAAFARVSRRHEVLGARIVAEGERVVMRKTEEDAPPARVVDVSGLSALEVEDRVGAELRQRMRIEEGELVRCLVFRAARDAHDVVLQGHHVAVDFQSIDTLLFEAGLAYLEGDPGGAFDMLPTPGSFFDFVEELNTQEDAAEEEARVFWVEQLRGAPAALELAADYRRSARHEAAAIPATISPAVGDRLRDIARSRRTTMFRLLLSAYAGFLSRATKQAEVLVGTPVTSRRAGYEATVGAFSGGAVLRLRTPPDATLLALSEAGGLRVKEARARAAVPFSRIRAHLDVERDPTRHPVYQTHLVYLPESRLPFMGAACLVQRAWKGKWAGLEVTASPVKVPVFVDDPLDCGLFGCTLPDGSIALNVEFNAALFTGWSARRLADAFVTFVASWSDSPETPLARVPMVSGPEQEQAAKAVGRELAPGPPSFLAAFHEVLRQHPTRVAVERGGERVTYAELAGAAGAFHGDLGTLPAESIVAFMAAPSASFLAAMLGTWAAGAAYLPLDTKSPDSRLASMLDVSRARVLVTDAAHAAQARKLASMQSDPPRVLELVAVGDGSPRAPLPDTRRHSRQLAYLIFTSGSTGLPKAVMIEEEGMVNHLRAKVDALGMGLDSRVVQNASPAFDISVWQMLSALMVGGATVVVDEVQARDPAALLAASEAAGATVLECVPSLLAAMMEAALPPPPALIWLLSTGEALAPELALALRTRWPEVALMNAYGPTECSDDVTHSVIEDVDARTAAMPIGVVLPGLSIYVLDDALRPVPEGLTGEVYVGGIGVGRGYSGDPWKSADRFRPDPYGPPGSRMYRTGDLGRWTAGKELVYFGRTDFQVKLRGHRIELGDVESALRRLHGVSDAVALARTVDGSTRLVGYVVCSSGASGRALRDTLKRELPAYAVPDYVVVLPAFPVNTSGKVDRPKLPTPEPEENESEDLATPDEQQVADVFAELLPGTRPRPGDDFFEMGGHSLLVLRLARRLGERFGVALKPSDVFDSSTVAAMARRVRGGSAAASGDEAALIERMWADSVGVTLAAARTPPAPSTVLLTGATGFVGSHLLAGLTAAGLRVLVLARDPDRLGDTAAHFGGAPPDLQRITTLRGDLSAPHLGLSDAEWRELADSVDAVVHAGADVSVARGYRDLVAANVSATRALVELAGRGRPKAVHHVSTLSVYAQRGTNEAVTGEPDDPRGLSTAYDQSKWVADRLVRASFRTGVCGAVYRPSLISGHSRSGAVKREAYTYSARLLACVDTALVPDVLNVLMCPVDEVCEVILAGTVAGAPGGRTVNIGTEVVPAEKLAAALSAGGHPARVVDYRTWLNAVRELVAAAPHHPFAPFADSMPDSAEGLPRALRFAGTQPAPDPSDPRWRRGFTPETLARTVAWLRGESK